MKLLYVDAAVQSLNPTATLTPHMIGFAVEDTTYFGPGFCSRDTVSLGVQRFVDGTGPYDIVVFGPNTPLVAGGEDAVIGAVKSQMQFSALRPPPEVLAGFYRDVLSCAATLPISLKAVSLLNFDYYATKPEQIDAIEKAQLLLIGPNAQFVTSVEDLPVYATTEKHYIRKKENISNAYLSFVSSQPNRVLTSLHFVGSNEFYFHHVDERNREISVPGAEYVLRAQAIATLKKNGRRMGSKAVFHAYRIANKVGLPVYSSLLSQRFFNVSYQVELAKTRAVYAARGGFGMPVRKFFEIPAAGALLICSPPIGSQSIGFRNAETCLVATPGELEAVLDQVSEDDSAGDIAVAGQRMVMKLHSIHARAAQLRRCLEATVSGSYSGAHWADGDFVVETKT